MRVAIVALLVVAACGSSDRPVESEDLTLRNGVELYERAAPLDVPVDADGIRLYEREGVRYRHPVAQSQYAVSLVEGFEETGNTEWLAAAERNARDLLDANGFVLEYGFDFPLHGDTSNTIRAPWRSAMAQGIFLSLTTRLWEHTGDQAWYDASISTFETLLPSDDEDWVTFVDDDGYLWLEEYAGDVAPMMVLNGHIFAMFGIYEYYMTTKDPRALTLFGQAAATVKRYVPELRVEGEASWYGMRIQDVAIAQSVKYHGIHIRQLRSLDEITGDPEFAELADLLESDLDPTAPTSDD